MQTEILSEMEASMDIDQINEYLDEIVSATIESDPELIAYVENKVDKIKSILEGEEE